MKRLSLLIYQKIFTVTEQNLPKERDNILRGDFEQLGDSLNIGYG